MGKKTGRGSSTATLAPRRQAWRRARASMGASLTGSAPTARIKSASSISRMDTARRASRRETAALTLPSREGTAKNRGSGQPRARQKRLSIAWVCRLLRAEPRQATAPGPNRSTMPASLAAAAATASRPSTSVPGNPGPAGALRVALIEQAEASPVADEVAVHHFIEPALPGATICR